MLPPKCPRQNVPAKMFPLEFDLFPWQEKLVAPLIANLIGYSQCKDSMTKSEGKKTDTGYINDSFA